MANCINYIPPERVRVFISSAQSNENGFAWSEVRRRIKDYLGKCVYLNPFIIEDEGSSTPSSQFFQRQVERADVIVLLVKGEVRNGTATEYALAVKLNKPLLVYFIEDESPTLDVVKLKKDIQTKDRCTYHPVPSFDNIEIIIRNDLMNDIIRAFQDKYYYSILDSDNIMHTEIPEVTILASTGIPSKTEIDRFSSCYNYLFDLLNLSHFKKETMLADLHEFGCALIYWLIKGKWEIKDEIIINFISTCPNNNVNTSLLEKRWDAIRSYVRGDLEKSLSFEEQALGIARESKESDWVISNILIDCRNIELEICKHNHKYSSNNVFQNELSNQRVTVCLPIIDRYLNNIYQSIEKEEFRVETATTYTQLFGSSMSIAITDLANYLFTAAIYGSVTHLLLTRKILANILNKFSKIHGEPSYLFSSLKQYVLDGNAKDYKLFLVSTWDEQYSSITSQADDIWKLTEYVPIAKRDTIKLTVFATLGSYFTDEVFNQASEYILCYSDQVVWDNSESYFDALLGNINRLNPEKTIHAIIPIISEKRFHLGNKVSHIILYADLKQVSEESLQRLSDALKIQLPFIIRTNGDPQMIAPLIERSQTIFGELEKMEGNGLTGIQESIYKINRGSGDWSSIIREEIESARAQFSSNSTKGVYHGFVHDPYYMISKIIRMKKDNDDLYSIILHEFVPLSIDVINSEAAVQTKEPCVACLCEVLSSLHEQSIDLPASVKQALQNADISKGTDFFSSNTRKALEIRVLMAQIMAGIDNEKGMLRWCIEFGTLDIKEKIVIIDCLEKYLYYKRSKQNTIDSLVVSIVLQCHSESHRDIRKRAVRCLAYLASSDYRDVAIVELNKAAYDTDDAVRYALLRICKADYLPSIIAANIISVLKNDSNYDIRYAANEQV